MSRARPSSVLNHHRSLHMSGSPAAQAGTVGTLWEAELRTPEDLGLQFANEVQQLLVEGQLWGAAWPPCPVHRGSHPLWPDTAEGEAIWACSTPPGFSTPIGMFRQDG